MKKVKTKITKVINPLTGKHFNVYENVVIALILKQSPGLIAMWQVSGSSKSLEDWLLDVDSTVKVKGAINKVIAKYYPNCVKALIEIWRNSDFSTFDDFLSYHHSANDTHTVK